MTADLDILLREVDDVKQRLAKHNELNVDSNVIFESLEQNGYRENRVEFVVRQFLGENELDEVAVEYVAVVNGGGETIDLTVDVAENKSPLLVSNEPIEKEIVTVTDEVINLDSDYSSDSSVEFLTNATSKSSQVKRKYKTAAKPKKRKKTKSCVDSAISSELSKDASTLNTDDTTYDLCDVNNNDPNNNFEPESSFQQAGDLSAQQTNESEFLNLPSTSNADINAPSCSFQPRVSAKPSYKCTAEDDLLSDDDGDVPLLNNDDILEVNQENIREQLLTEARFIHNLVPHQRLDEIFSYLEASLDSEDRMNVVLLHFLQRDKQRDDSGQQQELHSTFAENDSTAGQADNCINSQKIAIKTEIESLVSNEDGIADTYFAEGEIIGSISDDELPTIKTEIDMIPMNDVSTDNIPETKIDNTVKTRSPNRISASNLLDLTNKRRSTNEEKEIQKCVAILREMFPNLPKLLIEKRSRKLVWTGGSIEELILELLEMDSEVQESPPKENIARVLPERHSAVGSSSRPAECAAKNISVKVEEEEEEEVEELGYKTLLAIFPDADPEFLREKASTLAPHDECFRNFIIINLEQKGYPTLKDYEKRKERAALKKKYSEEFSVQAFLDAFPDPLNYFKEKKSLDNESRAYYAINYLKNKFRWLRMETLKEVYLKHEYNLTKAFEELETIQNGHSKKKRTKEFRSSQRLVADYPKIDELDVPFLQEIAFLDHKDEIDAYLKENAERRQKAFEEAKESGELLECLCCFDNEVLLEDSRSCEEGHLFCKECVKRSVEIAIGDGKTTFSCLTTCKSEFSLKVLQTVLKPDIFSKLIKRKQIEEIKQAGIEGLETCPFCDFASIPEEGNKIFKCLNPECMKESCRSCRQLSHIPLKCEEVEKDEEVKMRIYIEDRMTQALVRECWRCKQKFVKADGCNKMKCHCGAMMCYICRQPVKDYTHFNGQGGTEYHKCPLYSNNDELHVTAVEQEGLKAKREVQQLNPDLKLKHDPTKNLPKARERCDRIIRNCNEGRALCIHLRNAFNRMMVLHREVRRRRPRRMRAEPNVEPIYFGVPPMLEPIQMDGMENVYIGVEEEFEALHGGDLVNAQNFIPEPPQARPVIHTMVHGADRPNRIQIAPVQPADDARVNEVQPQPMERPIKVEGTHSTKATPRVRENKSQKKYAPKNSTRSQNQHGNHIARVMPNFQGQVNQPEPTREAMQVAAQPHPVRQAIPALQNMRAAEFMIPGPVRQPVRQNVQTHEYIQPGQGRQVIPVFQNVQTHEYIQPGPRRQLMTVFQDMQIPEFIEPGPVRRAIPVHQNMQIPEYIHPVPARQAIPVHRNVYTPEYIHPAPRRQTIPVHQTVQFPEYVQPRPTRQPIPVHQGMHTNAERIQPGPSRQVGQAHRNGEPHEQIQPIRARNVKILTKVRTISK